jgi:hypothetical protein
MCYIILQYSVTIYMNHHIYLKMVLCGENMALNSHESMIQPITCETTLNTALCMSIYEVIKLVQQNT